MGCVAVNVAISTGWQLLISQTVRLFVGAVNTILRIDRLWQSTIHITVQVFILTQLDAFFNREGIRVDIWEIYEILTVCSKLHYCFWYCCNEQLISITDSILVDI